MAQTVTEKRLIKGIIIELVIVLITSAVLLGAAFWAAGMSEEKQKEAEQMNNDINSKTGELQTLKAKMAQFKDAIPLRESLKGEDGKVSLNLSRDLATNIFLKLKDSYALNDIKINISPIKEEADAAFIKNYMRVISSDIEITMKAYSDSQIVHFMDDVAKELPGAIKIKNVSIKRGSVKSLADKTTTTATPSFNEPQLGVKINLVWYGIKDIENVTPENSAAPAGMVPPNIGQ